MSEPHDDPALELLSLTAALRAHVERLQGAGCRGLPAALPRAAQATPVKLASSDQPRPQPGGGGMRALPEKPDAATPPARATRGSSELPSPVSSPRPEPAAVRQELVVLDQRVRGCTACGLHKGRKQTVFARGDGSSGVCFIGEGPGADEDAQGLPFVGKAGQLLDRMIVAMGFSRDEVYVCNIVKCRPPDNRKPEPDEMAACTPYLIEQLTLIQPKVIVALGATAVQGLLGTTGGITRLRGSWRLYQGKVPVMPTFHPAYLLRNPRAKRDVWDDLQEVLRQLGRPIPSRG